MSRFRSTIAPRRRAVAASLAAGLVLSGCAQTGQDLSPDAAARLQEAVWTVSTAAAQGRLDAAGADLARVREELDRAAEEGEISLRRYRQVEEALRRTEAELAALESSTAGATEPDAEREPQPEPGAGSQSDERSAAAVEVAEVSRSVPVPAPAAEPTVSRDPAGVRGPGTATTKGPPARDGKAWGHGGDVGDGPPRSRGGGRP